MNMFIYVILHFLFTSTNIFNHQTIITQEAKVAFNYQFLIANKFYSYFY